MRKLLRSPIFKVQARSTLHEYKPEAEEVKIRNWVTQFGTIATKASSKVYLSQLNGLLQLYNKKIVDTTKVHNC